MAVELHQAVELFPQEGQVPYGIQPPPLVARSILPQVEYTATLHLDAYRLGKWGSLGTALVEYRAEYAVSDLPSNCNGTCVCMPSAGRLIRLLEMD